MSRQIFQVRRVIGQRNGKVFYSGIWKDTESAKKELWELIQAEMYPNDNGGLYSMQISNKIVNVS